MIHNTVLQIGASGNDLYDFCPVPDPTVQHPYPDHDPGPDPDPDLDINIICEPFSWKRFFNSYLCRYIRIRIRIRL
jgi:hypothetical protein